jgi:MoaA/NifB/PqqE/SkfB family radical SAM enzyme
VTLVLDLAVRWTMDADMLSRKPLPLIGPDGRPPLPGPPPPVRGNPFDTQAKVLFAHFDRLADLRRTGDTFPVLIEVNLTNYCNEACEWCISMYSHDGNPAMTADERRIRRVRRDAHPALTGRPDRQRGLEVGVLKGFLARARDMGLRAVTWSGGGEPTTHPDFLGGVRAAAEVGVEQGLMTNGFFPADYAPAVGETVRWVRVSLDTLDRDRYRQKKAIDALPRVLSTIRRLLRHPATVGVNMNLAVWNADELLPMARWCRDEGVGYFQVRPVLGLPFEMARTAAYRSQPRLDWDQLRADLEAAEGLSTSGFRVAVSWDKFVDVHDPSGNFGRTYSGCLYHYLCCVLNADGDLCVCMYHLGDRAFTFGNIYEETVEAIWAGPKRREVVGMCATALDLSSCQVCCKGHEVNKLLHRLGHPGGTDVNFI